MLSMITEPNLCVEKARSHRTEIEKLRPISSKTRVAFKISLDIDAHERKYSGVASSTRAAGKLQNIVAIQKADVLISALQQEK